jgi:hypothetical protein
MKVKKQILIRPSILKYISRTSLTIFSFPGFAVAEFTITLAVNSKICGMATITATTEIAILDESFIPKIPGRFLSYTPERTGTGPAPYGCNPGIPAGPHIVGLGYSPAVWWNPS